MTCQITFLPVGNADSIVIQANESLVIIDLGKLEILEDWLEKHKVTKINKIYVTHAHSDHFPDLIKLATFLGNWLETNPSTTLTLCLPYLEIQRARNNVIANRGSFRARLLEDALNRIIKWDDQNEYIQFIPLVSQKEDHIDNLFGVDVLHPTQVYIENHLATTKSKLNEVSAVLLLTYGCFSALFLADIEGIGLTKLLEKYNKRKAFNFIQKVNLVKIPHHGAWPKNGEDLKTLLEFIDPEIAVLSVCSKNPHGHVKPELFAALNNLKNDSSKRLNQFICTEVTRTCKYSASNCLKMDRKGLSSTEKCAGEITIIAEDSGKWTLKTETKHSDVVKNFNYAACTERADLI